MLVFVFTKGHNKISGLPTVELYMYIDTTLYVKGSIHSTLHSQFFFIHPFVSLTL